MGIIQFATMSTENMKLLSLIITVATLIITLIISVGWVNVVLRLIRGNSKKWEDFKVSPKILWKVFVSQIITGIPIFVLGIIIIVNIMIFKTLLSIVLGVSIWLVFIFYIKIRFMFLSNIAIDHKGLRIIELLKKSANITRYHTVDLIGFGILMILINIAGFALALVGLLITVPLTLIAKTYVYEKIKDNNTH